VFGYAAGNKYRGRFKARPKPKHEAKTFKTK
jgi:hypothetical protein